MNATRWLGLAVSAGILGGTLGCAQTSTTASAPAPAIPDLQSPANGAVAPDKLIVENQKIMVNGEAMTVEQIRKQLPSRISAADAAKMLVQINPDQIVKEDAKSDLSTQQWRGRGFFGRGFYGRGFFGGYGLYSRSLFGYGGFGYYPFGSFYWPYYSYAGYYYPFSYASYYYPYLYGYSGLYYPYFYRWWW